MKSKDKGGTFTVQLLCSKEMRTELVLLQELLDYTMDSESLELTGTEQVLIFIVPRYSNKERVVAGVLPNMTIRVRKKHKTIDCVGGFRCFTTGILVIFNVLYKIKSLRDVCMWRSR